MRGIFTLALFLVIAFIIFSFLAPFFWMFIGLAAAYFSMRKIGKTEGFFYKLPWILGVLVGIWIFIQTIPSLWEIIIFAVIVSVAWWFGKRSIRTISVNDFFHAQQQSQTSLEDRDNVVEGEWREID